MIIAYSRSNDFLPRRLYPRDGIDPPHEMCYSNTHKDRGISIWGRKTFGNDSK